MHLKNTSMSRKKNISNAEITIALTAFGQKINQANIITFLTIRKSRLCTYEVHVTENGTTLAFTCFRHNILYVDPTNVSGFLRSFGSVLILLSEIKSNIYNAFSKSIIHRYHIKVSHHVLCVCSQPIVISHTISFWAGCIRGVCAFHHRIIVLLHCPNFIHHDVWQPHADPSFHCQ